MNSTKLIVGALFILSLSSCASSGPKYQAYSDEFRKNAVEVVVFRRAKTLGAGECPNVFVNEQKLGKLTNGSYLRILIPSLTGSLVVRVYEREVVVRAVDEAQKRYFFEYAPGYQGEKLQLLGEPSALPVVSELGLSSQSAICARS